MIGPGSGITMLDSLATLGGVNRVRRAPIEPTPRLPVNRIKDRVDLSPEALRQSEKPDEAEQRELAELRKTDREVRAHEQAHKAAAGQYAGAVSYEYTTGPDGRRYATGGSVAIDSSPIEGDPEATIRKMQTVRRAALAPGEPSPQDRRVAAEAAEQERMARAEQQKSEGGSHIDVLA